MKRIMLFFALSFISFACKKTCDVYINYPVPGVAFKGFTDEDIDSAKVYRYIANTGFSELISIEDVSDNRPPKIIGGIAFSFSNYHNETRGYFYVEKGTDYKVIMRNPLQEFVITDVRSGPKSKTVTQTKPCGGVELSPVSYDMKINDEDYTPQKMEGAFYIVLER